MSTSWLDGGGFEWTLRIDVPTAARLESELGIDVIAASADPTQLQGILETLKHPVKLVQALTVICEPEDPEAFGRGFSNGDIIESAFVALVEGLIDFFGQGVGERLRRIWQDSLKKTTEYRETTLQEMDRKIDALLSDTEPSTAVASS